MKNTIEKPTSNDELNETPCAADSAAHGGDLLHWTEAELVAENARRNAALVQDYDPMTGRGCCGDRVARKVGSVDYMLSRTMIDGAPKSVYRSRLKFQKARFEYDFEFWAAMCVKIIDKTTHRQVPFVLNRAQRKLLSVLEGQRAAGQPIRVILLKARQWGGSTLVQIYMAWIQLVLKENWNSLICGHLRDTASAIKGMYSRLLANYPEQFKTDGMRQMRFKTYEGSKNVSVIDGRGCIVMMGSARSQEEIRGYDIMMAHLSEVAFWPETDRFSPVDLVRAVGGTVTLAPHSLIVMESTANGQGNFFHTEWLRAKSGRSDKQPVFVPWHDIEIYRLPVGDVMKLWRSLDGYELDLWREGLTLEQINWYHHKRMEYPSHALMKAEFPSNDIEAFANTGRCIFDLNQLAELRRSCHAPAARGDIYADYKTLNNVGFVRQDNGLLEVWRQPDYTTGSNRYVVTVDVGGRSDSADYSVIAVTDCLGTDGRPEVVAQWRGHIDHDLLAWKSAQIAKYYCNALLVVESNTLETERCDGDGGEYVLDTIGRFYRNVYCRPGTCRVGFHTNRETKQKALYDLIAAVRDGTYVEHDAKAVDEMSWYEQKINGQWGAMRGKHDDILMTRCITLKVINDTRRQQWLARRGGSKDCLLVPTVV